MRTVGISIDINDKRVILNDLTQTYMGKRCTHVKPFMKENTYIFLNQLHKYGHDH